MRQPCGNVSAVAQRFALARGCQCRRGSGSPPADGRMIHPWPAELHDEDQQRNAILNRIKTLSNGIAARGDREGNPRGLDAGRWDGREGWTCRHAAGGENSGAAGTIMLVRGAMRASGGHADEAPRATRGNDCPPMLNPTTLIRDACASLRAARQVSAERLRGRLHPEGDVARCCDSTRPLYLSRAKATSTGSRTPDAAIRPRRTGIPRSAAAGRLLTPDLVRTAGSGVCASQGTGSLIERRAVTK